MTILKIKPLFILRYRRIIFVNKFLSNYLDTFKLSSIFVNAYDQRYFWIPEVGLLYIYMLPLIFYGLYLILFKKVLHKKIILLLIFISPIASALAVGNLLAHRAFTLLLPLLIISSLAISPYQRVTFKYQKFIVIISIGIVSLSLVHYLHLSFFHAPRSYAKYWNYPVREVVSFALKNEERFNSIVISTNKGLFFYFALFGFNDIFNCHTCLKDFQQTLSYSKYQFKSINWVEDKNLPGSLLIGFPNEISIEDNFEYQDFYQPNGEVVLRAALIK